VSSGNNYAYSDEAYEDIIRKYKGLMSEYLTLKDRWQFSSNVLESKDILPDIFQEGGLDNDIRYYSKIVERFTSNPTSTQEHNKDSKVVAITDIRYVVEKMARIVSFTKSGFFQRTDSIDLPYVIAGTPFSPERSWGNELYLVAADKLVQNYLSYLNMSGRRWDRFVTWAEFPSQQRILPGGQYIPAHRTFHLNLAMDVKYNLQGFLILAHEITHAACQGSVDTIGGEEVYTVLTNALIHVFPLKEKILEILEKCKTETQMNWRHCTLRQWVKVLSAQGVQDFVEAAAESEFAKYMYEGLIDMVAMRLSGTSYIGAMNDYVFEPAVCHTYPGGIGLKWNPRFYFGVLLRTSMLESYVFGEVRKQTLPDEYLAEASTCFQQVQYENESVLENLYKNVHACMHKQCIKCLSEVALLIGSQVSKFDKKIFKDVFFSKKNVLFSTDKNVLEEISIGKVVNKAEPRKILDSCGKLMRKNRSSSCPAALFSLAFNEQE
jgi:hypothetical protein